MFPPVRLRHHQAIPADFPHVAFYYLILSSPYFAPFCTPLVYHIPFVGCKRDFQVRCGFQWGSGVPPLFSSPGGSGVPPLFSSPGGSGVPPLFGSPGGSGVSPLLRWEGRAPSRPYGMGEPPVLLVEHDRPRLGRLEPVPDARRHLREAAARLRRPPPRAGDDA